MKVIGYLRVSTREQADSGLGLDAQRRTISVEAERRGWEVEWLVDDGRSARNLNRPALTEALALLKQGEASALVVAKLDRLSRSVSDFAAVLATADKQRWAVVALDLGVDTTTPAGELVAGVMMVIAQWERRIIGVRTREAMAEAKANGARFGRIRQAAPGTVARILHERAEGQSFNAIAAGLDADDIPTPGGGLHWYGSTVTRLHRAETNDKQREEVA